MTAAAGFPALRLVRTEIGDWSVEGLEPGEHRSITVHAPRAAKRRVKRRPRQV